MKSLRTTLLSAAVLASAGLFAAPALASAPTFVDLANKVCAPGKDETATSITLSFPGLSDLAKATALGEASRQLDAKACKGAQGEIDAALVELKKVSDVSDADLDAAYASQKNSGQKEAGDGVKGQYVEESAEVGDTVVSTAAGEAISK